MRYDAAVAVMAIGMPMASQWHQREKRNDRENRRENVVM